jgi:2-polyprenyl-3-methyl-5-hydroxy-6-metoxy-1,4-benzoquinol methylase
MRKVTVTGIRQNELISDEVRMMCTAMHAVKKDKWGNDGHKRGDIVLEFINELQVKSVLDYGCGRGTLAKRLGNGGKKIKGLHWMGPVYEYDPALPKKSVARAADLVVCTDVLEHVEPNRLHVVLAHMHGLARRGLFLLISTREANKVMPDGRNAHLIVQPAEWWLLTLGNAGYTIVRHEIHSSELLVWCVK